MKKILSIALMILMLCCLVGLVSCAPDGDGSDCSVEVSEQSGGQNSEQSGGQNSEQSGEQGGEQNSKYVSEYVAVIPENADTTTRYAAENLVNLVEEKTGKKMNIVSDTVSPQEKEILIGDTSRAESQTQTELSNEEYLVLEKNGKIVIKGYGIYIGAGCGAFVNEYAAFNKADGKIDITNVPKEERTQKYTPAEKPKNVIFMIGDGMGFNHIALAECNGLDAFLAKSFPNQGSSVTRSQSVINGDKLFTDSAASGTAMATGYKTINGYIGLDKNGNPIQNIRELAYLNGAKTAVITTDVITGATPSAYMCHNISRNNTEELEAQINALVNEGKIDYCAGSVDNNLTSEIGKALALISADNSSFFMMIEEGIIDKKAHSRDKEGIAQMVIRFDDAIAYATQFTLCHPDTALIVTADHETGGVYKHKDDYRFRSSDHTNADVPVYALGAGTSIFNGAKVENIDLAKFCASVYSTEPFGQAEPIE